MRSADVRLSPRKWVLLGVLLFVMTSVVVVASMLERPMPVEREFVSSQPVQYTTTRTVSSSNDLFAIVKGSIYETGSNMTVFGACENGDGYLLPASTANFTAWYPNGTIMMGPNATMDQVLEAGNATGRYKIHVTMPSTIGTYFTEMRCEYNGDYALAFGEWQNPEWVKKIGDNYVLSLQMNDTLQNVTVTLEELNALIQSQNVSAILEALQNLNSTITEITTSEWTVDLLNVAFNQTGAGPSWTAVDIVGSSETYVAARNGSFGRWNGLSWSYGAVPGYTWSGVSGLSQTLNYFWLVGRAGEYSNVIINFDNDSMARYSVSGSTPTMIPGSTAGEYVDVRLFRASNESLSQFSVLILANDGKLYVSNDQGTTWQDFVQYHNVTPLAGGKGRLSDVVWTGADYEFAVVTQGGSFLYQNASSGIWQDNNSSRSYRDVTLRSGGTGYVTGVVAGVTKVWHYNGTSLNEVMSTSDGLPSAIAFAEDDVWLVLDDPSIYYLFNGTAWTRQVYPYSQVPIVWVNFDTSGSLFTGGDMDIYGKYTGYSVSGGGLIMRLQVDTQIQQLLTSIQLILLSGSGMSQAQFDMLMGNVTYTQDYLNTTVVPKLDAILVWLGLIDAKVNATLEITNRTEQKVDLLLNRSERPRVWTTQ